MPTKQREIKYHPERKRKMKGGGGGAGVVNKVIRYQFSILVFLDI